MKEFDDTLEEVTVLHELPLNMRVLRIVQRGSLFSLNRDYFVLNHVLMDPQTGAIETVAGSVEDPMCPHRDDCLRANVKILGARMVPATGGGTEVTMVSMTELKGNLSREYVKNVRTTFYNYKGILRRLKKRYKNIMTAI